MTKLKPILIAGAFAPLLFLAGCSGDSDTPAAGTVTTGADGAATTAAGSPTKGAASPRGADGGQGGQQTATPPRDATKDVQLDKCAVENGTAQVSAKVKSSADATENYVIAVEVLQSDKRVDGVALLATVEPGKTETSQMSGTKSDLKGDITCKVTSVRTVGG